MCGGERNCAVSSRRGSLWWGCLENPNAEIEFYRSFRLSQEISGEREREREGGCEL